MSNQTDKATPWQILNLKFGQPQVFKKVRHSTLGIETRIVNASGETMATVPAKAKAFAPLIVKAVNEYDALCAVEKSLRDELEKHYGTKDLSYWLARIEGLQPHHQMCVQVEALATLAAIRAANAGKEYAK